MSFAGAVLDYREALGRARNVVCDLEDFEWIGGRTEKDAEDELRRISAEARKVAALLLRLSGSGTSPYSKSEG